MNIEHPPAMNINHTTPMNQLKMVIHWTEKPEAGANYYFSHFQWYYLMLNYIYIYIYVKYMSVYRVCSFVSSNLTLK